MAVKQRVLVIGLDCATPQLVFDRFAGELEHLSRLRQEGCWGELRSVIPAITVPAWACGITSHEPGRRLEGLEIVDCAPTFLRRLGESVPETMIGRVVGG